MIWYIPVLFLLLYLWQEVFLTAAVRTIPYSEFKEYVQRHEVASCEIGESEIVGVIEPKTPTAGPQQAKPETQPGKTELEQGKVQPKQAKPGSPPAKPPAPLQEKPPAATPPAPNAGKPGEAAPAEKEGGPQSFSFRTERVVPDPELVPMLDKAGVQYRGVRPSRLSSLLFAWVIPIALISLLWFFVARRIGRPARR